ncbi:hypothetical protein Naga_100055g2 [Nannochloropsis gaditana]|uniref:Uncharacterized protein n=1 Tax=Nannochloropsis gaditana TaxID=72520 RepID=W7TVN9_9STRA|nr:hypothetical protein Naga_100055g2 [Nannochloropsis gaditana]
MEASPRRRGKKPNALQGSPLHPLPRNVTGSTGTSVAVGEEMFPGFDQGETGHHCSVAKTHGRARQDLRCLGGPRVSDGPMARRLRRYWRGEWRQRGEACKGCHRGRGGSKPKGRAGK